MDGTGSEMKVWFKLKRRLKSRVYRNIATLRLLLVVFSGVTLSLLFASGSYVQSAFTAFMSGDKSSLYEGMFGAGLVQFPSFGTYIQTAFSYQYLVSGLLVSAAIAWINSKRQFLIWVAIAIAASLTTIDVINGAISQQDFGVSVICNILAGIILALFSFTIVANISFIKYPSDGNKFIERAMWVVWPATYFFILAAIIFFILAFIMKIPASTVSIRLNPPMSGYFLSTDPARCNQANTSSTNRVTCSGKTEGTDDEGKLSVLSVFSPNSGSDTKWLGVGKKLSIDWRKKNSASLGVSFRMAQGCQTRDQLNKALKIPPFAKNVINGDINIGVDDGLSQFQPISSDYTGQIRLDDDDPSTAQFWIVPASNDSSKLNVQRFIRNGSIHLTDQFKPLSYEIGIFFSNEKNGNLAPRHFVITTTNPNLTKSIEVKIDSRPINPNSQVRCEELKVSPVDGGYVAMARTPLVSLLVSVENGEKVPYQFLKNPDILEITGINGWVSNDGFEKSKIDNFIKVGKVAGISVFGVISDVQVNEKSIATGPTSTLMISGPLSVTSDGTSIMILGDAHYMSLNDHRLTLTRWESLDTALRAAILVGVPTILYFLLRLLGKALREPMRHIWYLPR